MTSIKNTYSTHVLEDGATIAYEILGSHHIGSKQPIILLGGMAFLRGDYERLSTSLALKRPVLIYDYRGMGDSTLTPREDDVITIESLARDLFSLLCSLQWKQVSLCGFSMGGVIIQQLLLLPYHTSNPTSLPFTVTHVLLTGTLCSVLRDRRYGLRINTTVPDRPLTYEKRREITRSTVETTLDPHWISNPANAERLEWWLNRMTPSRPRHVISMQARAMGGFNFDGLYNKLPRKIQFLIIHGKLDKIIPLFRGEEILRRIPWAKMVEVGSSPGQIPDFNFGHVWFEYFDIQIWQDAIEQFLGPSSTHMTRL